MACQPGHPTGLHPLRPNVLQPPALDLAAAQQGTFALLDQRRRDYAALQVMTFSEVPAFDTIGASVVRLEPMANGEGRA